MALATRCPACDTVFRISTMQAAAKGGMVRCGQCRNVFNSLDALVRVEDLEVIDEVEVGSHAEVAADRSSASAALGDSPSPAPALDTAAPPPEVDDVGAAATLPADAEPASTNDPVDAAAVDVQAVHRHGVEADRDAESAAHSQIEPDPAVADDAFEATRFAASGSTEVPATGTDSPVTREWWLPDPADPAADPAADATASGSDAGTTDRRDDAGRLLSGSRMDLEATGLDRGMSPAFMVETRPGRTGRWILAVLSLVAAVGLVAQLAFVWRDELAVRWPPARPWLTAACVPLRCRVGYPMHLDSITIESATVQTTGANLDVYALNALLRNRDAVDVRYPHLELVLTDLQDRPILRRALRPEDYLPAGRDADRGASGFAAQSEQPIHVLFELGDLRFAGYRLDKFYP